MQKGIVQPFDQMSMVHITPQKLGVLNTDVVQLRVEGVSNQARQIGRHPLVVRIDSLAPFLRTIAAVEKEALNPYRFN